MPNHRLLPALLALMLAAPLAAQSGKLPTDGTKVLEQMRARYAKRWYQTLEFSQKTTINGRNGTREETWHEWLWQSPQRGTVLRINHGEPALGNVTFYTADSSYAVRGGKLVQSNADGNFFLPLIEGVYRQPVERTVKDLASAKFDLSKVREGAWQGGKVWVVGAGSADDTTSAQFWVDPQRLVVVRVIIALGAGQPPLDVHLENYVETGGGWLATKISMFGAGKLRQMEEYYDWKTGHAIDPKLFEPPAATP